LLRRWEFGFGLTAVLHIAGFDARNLTFRWTVRERQFPTQNSLRTRPIERPEAVIRPAELRAAALDPKLSKRLLNSKHESRLQGCEIRGCRMHTTRGNEG
jgi:hypothetical protein